MTNVPAGRTAPTDLKVPEYVGNWTGNRQEKILEHGFGAGKLALGWWNEELVSQGLGGHTVSVDPNGHHATKLTRQELFTLAAKAGDSDDATLNFLWHVLVWGSGNGVRNNRQRIAALADPAARGHRIELLQTALGAAAEGGPDAPREAYGALIKPGGGVIPGLGPAFFTKFLYFGSGGEADNRCLILDARVAGSLYRAGWVGIPHTGGKFSYNWYTDTYVSYCATATRWANELNAAPDEIERALFEGSPPEA